MGKNKNVIQAVQNRCKFIFVSQLLIYRHLRQILNIWGKYWVFEGDDESLHTSSLPLSAANLDTKWPSYSYYQPSKVDLETEREVVFQILCDLLDNGEKVDKSDRKGPMIYFLLK